MKSGAICFADGDSGLIFNFKANDESEIFFLKLSPILKIGIVSVLIVILVKGFQLRFVILSYIREAISKDFAGSNLGNLNGFFAPSPRILKVWLNYVYFKLGYNINNTSLFTKCHYQLIKLFFY
jgi:hypothetical protein